MDNSIYEVSRDEYVGFLDQIKPSAKLVENAHLDGYKVIKTMSLDTGTLWCTRIIPENEEENEHYYIFDMPADYERKKPTVKRKIILETKEEVEAFFNILNKMSKE